MATVKTGISGRLTINTVQRQLNHYNGDLLVKTYPIAVGKPSTPTPPGHYSIINKIVNPGGILGTRWMGLNIPGGNYGIHGTNNPASIGTAASLGCIRMHNHHAEELFSLVTIGTPVQIVANASSTTPWKPNFNPSPLTPLNSAPANGGEKSYTVKPGDTLWKIAQKFNISLEALVTANKLPNPDQINPGQIIIIP